MDSKERNCFKMSGDVQPRKRKDKKKKKEGTSLGNIHEPILPQKFRGKSFDDDVDTTTILGSVDPGEKIHIHNEHGIGGNICVKIIFFCLLGALVAAVGIIFIHSRGSTDIDLPSIEDSRFADYFTGWLDDAPDDHGHEEHEVVEGVEGHDEEEDEHGGEEHSEEDAPKSEEEGHGEEEDDYGAKEDTEDGSQEAGDNEEKENVDDSEEKQEEDGDDSGVGDDEEDSDAAPKFKVVHRFRHFFNKRKQFMDDKIEEPVVKKRKRYAYKIVKAEEEDEKREEKEEIEKNEEDEDEEEEEEEEEEDSEDDEETIRSDEVGDSEEVENGTDEDENIERNKKSAGKGYEEKDEEEDEDDDEDEDEGEGEEKEEVEADDDDYSAEKDKEDKYVVRKEEYEASEEEKPDEDDGDENEDEDEDENEEGDQAGTPKINFGLDEIDESEEALKEEEIFVRKKISPTEEEEEEKEEIDIKDDEIVEVESKIMDIEEKLNQILREKRKSVEKRKMELEEIEMEPITEGRVMEEEKENEEEEEQETVANGVAVKVIVGIALIVVAHLVLVQKWKSMGNPPDEKTDIENKEEKETKEEVTENVEPVISRRQTLVPEAADLNEYFADEIEEEEDEEEGEEEDDGEEGEDEEEEISEEAGYSEEEEEVVTKDGRSWNLEYSSRVVPLQKEYEEYSEEEEELEEEEEEEEEEVEEVDDEEIEDDQEEEEEEDMEEDDYGWKRLETVKPKVVEEPVDVPPVPPPRRSHLTSGERRGGPQGIDDDVYEVNDAFQDMWDSFGSTDQVEQPETEAEHEDEEDEKMVPEEVEDDEYKEEFKFAEDQLENNPNAALKKYESILSKKPENVRALIGRGKAFDKIAEIERSNQYLKAAVNAYKFVLTKHEDELDNDQYLRISERCVERMRFGGYFKSAIEIHKGLIRRFPNNPRYRNDLAVTYLFLNEISSARSLLNDTLKIWPKNGFALAHYGFILKTADNNHGEAAKMLMAGIKSREPGVIDGRFFFHLGDALNRLGRGKEAIEWYDQGVKEGLFLSRYQRSLYNVDRLKGRPWWTHRETTYQDFFKKLEDNWQDIRKEGLNLLNSKGVNLFKEEAENLKDTGDWRQLDLYFRGMRHSNCDKAPFTCSLIGSFHPASTCKRGQVKFSVMLPSTHVWPHCGPTNCRLRSHLGLVVPENTFLRVAEETRSWEEGKVLVFDDSFEHEVWHNGTGPRLVLIVDVWHPELTLQERKYLSPI